MKATALAALAIAGALGAQSFGVNSMLEGYAHWRRVYAANSPYGYGLLNPDLGLPSINTQGRPILGSTITLTITGSRSSTYRTFVLAGVGRSPIPLTVWIHNSEGNVLVDPTLICWMPPWPSPTNPYHTVTLTIPNDPALMGATPVRWQPIAVRWTSSPAAIAGHAIEARYGRF